MSNKTLIIAEAGVNHNGNLELAKRLADEAKAAGADIVKFQTADLDCLVSIYADSAGYQKENLGKKITQKEMLQSLLLSYGDFDILFEYCNKIGIEFLSTPFDIPSIDFLNDKVRLWKIPSGEVTNLPYLIKIAKTKKPVIMSTGMCEMAEIEKAVDILKQYGVREISLLHCNTEYPTPYEDVNLRTMKTLKEKFNVPVGYSDHTIGIDVPVAAAALGAVIIEKHFTLDKNMTGPDHKASLEPQELKRMIESIRNIEMALGGDEKKPTKSEKANLIAARKSIVAKTNINKGDIFTEQNITTKRPGNGISPMQWYEVLGTPARRHYLEDELIEL